MIRKILEKLDLNNIKENKLYFIIRIIYSILLSLSITLGSLTVYSSRFDDINNAYFQNVELKHMIMFVIIFFLIFVLVSLLGRGIGKLDENSITQIRTKKKSKSVYFIIFLILILLWLPYILSYFPGGVFGDTNNTLRQIYGDEEINNHHPLLYMILLAFFILITSPFNNLNVALGLFSIFQVMLMAGMIAYFIYYLYKKDINIIYIILLTAFFGLFKLFPLNAISIWKDTIYGIAILFFTFIITIITTSNENKLADSKIILYYCFSMFLVAFFRSNGLYVAIATTLILYIWLVKSKKYKNAKKFIIATIIEIIIFIIIEGPIFHYYKLNTEFVEAIGIPLQQISYVIATDGNISKEEEEFVNNIMPIYKIKERYRPTYVDYIKYSKYFNREFLDQHKSEFFKVYFQLFQKNKVAYIKAYLLQTLGFWDVVSFNEDDCSASPEIDIAVPICFPGAKQYDLIQIISGGSIRDILLSRFHINSAIFEFIVLLSLVFVFKTKRYKNILIYLPILFTLATVLISVPVAVNLRYTFSIILVMPFTLMFPLIGNKD